MSKELQVAIEAANKAGGILMRNFGNGIGAERKTEKELVTSADLQSEKKIIEILQCAFPDYNILSEEAGDLDKRSECTWVVDPLDGTHNFFSGLPLFGISIALARGDEIQCGAILLPIFNELFTAEKGKGAFLNGKPIHVSRRCIADATIAFCELLLQTEERMQKLKQINSDILSLRHLGSAVFTLSSLAAGRIDAIVELKERPCDYAAGWLLIEEAGGKFTTLGGEKFSLKEHAYIASNSIFHDKLVAIFGGKK